MTKNRQEEILTLSQACGLLHCHPNTLRKWDNSGFLKAIRFGIRGDRRYYKSDIEKLISKMKSRNYEK